MSVNLFPGDICKECHKIFRKSIFRDIVFIIVKRRQWWRGDVRWEVNFPDRADESHDFDTISQLEIFFRNRASCYSTYLKKELVGALNIWLWKNLWFREHCSFLHHCSLWYRISRDRCNLRDLDEDINPFRYNHEAFDLHFWREDQLACPMLRLVPNRIGGEPSLFRFSAIKRLIMVMIEIKDSIPTAVVSRLWPGRRRLSCTWISWDDNSKPCNRETSI